MGVVRGSHYVVFVPLHDIPKTWFSWVRFLWSRLSLLWSALKSWDTPVFSRRPLH